MDRFGGKVTSANLQEPERVTRETSCFRIERTESFSANIEGSRSNLWIACGIFLVVLGIYSLSSPGRIDIIDGQARFDVAYNWLVTGRPIMRDNLIGPLMSVPGRHGLHYSYYGAPASIFAMPLVWLGLYTSAPAIQPSQFLFSLTSAIIGAGIAPILFLFYLELGVTRRKAFAWTMVSSFATLVWPSSTSTFDNAQHAFFALAAVYFGFLSARRKSFRFAVLGGLMGGILILYQEYFLLIIPALALSTLDWEFEDSSENLLLGTKSKPIVPRVVLTTKRATHRVMAWVRTARQGPGEARSSCVRYCLFLTAVAMGVILSLAYNNLRFGSWLHDGKVTFAAERNYTLLGNPVAGLLTLLVSPGKSVLLYSPPLILGFLGIAKLRRRNPGLVTVIAAASVILVLFISCISFAGGDWCWGPRYLTPLLPLWALAMPFAVGFKLRRDLALAIIGVGFLVQILALSVENQRFFFARGLNDFFWAEDRWFYLKHSALLARVTETASLKDGAPATADLFSSTPLLATYAPLGPPPAVPRNMTPVWIRHFQIFYLPRPWPLWMSYLPPARRPIPVGPWLAGLLGLTALGTGLICHGFREGKFQ